MFTFEEYLIGWLIYMVAAVGLLVVFWRLTRAIPWIYLKQCLRLVVAALLLVPMTIPDAAGLWSPAWVQGLLLLVFEGTEGFMPIARVLLLAALIVLLIYLLLVIGLTFYRRRYHKASQ